MEYYQKIIEDGNQRTLREFAHMALDHLKDSKFDNEVVQQAANIVELEHDAKTHPNRIYELPDGYGYRFSGYFGQVIGIVKA